MGQSIYYGAEDLMGLLKTSGKVFRRTTDSSGRRGPLQRIDIPLGDQPEWASGVTTKQLIQLAKEQIAWLFDVFAKAQGQDAHKVTDSIAKIIRSLGVVCNIEKLEIMAKNDASKYSDGEIKKEILAELDKLNDNN